MHSVSIGVSAVNSAGSCQQLRARGWLLLMHCQLLPVDLLSTLLGRQCDEHHGSIFAYPIMQKSSILCRIPVQMRCAPNRLDLPLAQPPSAAQPASDGLWSCGPG